MQIYSNNWSLSKKLNSSVDNKEVEYRDASGNSSKQDVYIY